MAALAARQHGVVSRPQLRTIGFERGAIAHRVERGRLHIVHRGVYAVGHTALTIRGRWMAAVLAAGPGAALSHRAAAALHRIRESQAIEVSAPRQLRLGRRVRCHRATLPDDETATVDGILVTTAFRTLIDLAAVLSRHQLERAMNETERLQIAEPVSLRALIARHHHRRGLRTLKALTDDLDLGTAVTKSELEDRFLAFLDESGLPRPQTNRHVNGHECDCVWPARRLIVELDGHANHATRAAYERDRVRDRRLMTTGWRVIRVTWRQLHHDRRAVSKDLRELLR